VTSARITLVGGGSYSWGPGVVANILQPPYLGGSTVVLHDVDAEALSLVHAVARRYGDLAGSDIAFETTTDLDTALHDADYVVVTISTGGLQAMAHDLAIPERHGICQTVGDTVGPGGLLRALRNVPVFLELGRAMQRLCPDAWMLNCSNPLSVLTRVVNKETGVRALGVCHGVRGAAAELARFFGVDREATAYVNTGIDHCAWFTEFVIDGVPATQRLVDLGLDDWLTLPPEQAKTDETFGALFGSRCGLLLGRQLGALPAIGDRHMVEFFPGFLEGPDAVARHGLVRTTVDERQARREPARQRLQRLAVGDEAAELPSPSDDVAGWIAALAGGPVIEDNLNAPNDGQIPELPAGAVLETRGVLDASGCRPLVSPMPASLAAAVAPHVWRQELTVEAAVEGDAAKALAVLASDPLSGPAESVRSLLEEMMAATRQWLPQFTGDRT
jgi:alpha-galactosidase